MATHPGGQANTLRWDGETHKLTGHVQKTIPRDQELVFTFTLQNPASVQESPPISAQVCGNTEVQAGSERREMCTHGQAQREHRGGLRERL